MRTDRQMTVLSKAPLRLPGRVRVQQIRYSRKRLVSTRRLAPITEASCHVIHLFVLHADGA